VCCKTDGHFAKECVQTRDSRDSQRYRRDSHRDYIPLQTLLTDTPEKMLSNSGDLEIIKRLKSIRIKLGDNILLNYKKTRILVIEGTCRGRL